MGVSERTYQRRHEVGREIGEAAGACDSFSPGTVAFTLHSKIATIAAVIEGKAQHGTTEDCKNVHSALRYTYLKNRELARKG